MRTAMPLVTWSMITEYGPSATSLAISTPRLIGPGMHDDDIGLGAGEGALGQAEVARVFVDRGEEVLALALELDAQHHDHVGVAHAGVQIAGASRPRLRSSGGSRVGGPTRRTVRAEGAQREDVRARHAAVQDVADDGHREAVEAALALANGERVEQRLRRVLVGAVAGVDDRAVDARGEEVRRPGRGMAHDDRVGPHRVEVARRVEQRLALGDAAGRDGETDDVGAHAFGGDLERGRVRVLAS